VSRVSLECGVSRVSLECEASRVSLECGVSRVSLECGVCRVSLECGVSRESLSRAWSLELQFACVAVICKVCKTARLLVMLQLRHRDSSGTQRKGNICC
jgi:hypothetical protein